MLIILSIFLDILALISNIGGAWDFLKDGIRYLILKIFPKYSGEYLDYITFLLFLFLIAIFLFMIRGIFTRVSQTNKSGLLSKKSNNQRKKYLEWFMTDKVSYELNRRLEGEAYLQLRLRERKEFLRSNQNTEIKSNENRIYSINDILNKNLNRGLLLLGAPGSGKTTALYRIAEAFGRLAESDIGAKIPIILNLSTWRKLKGNKKNEDDFVTWVINSRPKYENGDINIMSSILIDWIQNEKLIYLIDGLDEVDAISRNEIVEKLASFHADLDDTPFIICSRTNDYETLIQSTNYENRIQAKEAFEILPLESEQIQNYLRKRGAGNIAKIIQNDKNKKLQEISHVPLYLELMVSAYKNLEDIDSNKPFWDKKNEHFSMTLFKMKLVQQFISNSLRRAKIRKKDSHFYHAAGDYGIAKSKKKHNWLSSLRHWLPSINFKETDTYKYLSFFAQKMSQL